MGSTCIKFSTIVHLDQFHRDNIVHKIIDARDAQMKLKRMSNKRKIVESRNEPLSKIFKRGDGTADGANEDTTSTEETPSAGPSTEGEVVNDASDSAFDIFNGYVPENCSISGH